MPFKLEAAQVTIFTAFDHPGSYDRFLDQDDWYAQQLAREREALLQKEREKEAAREADRDRS